MKNMELDGNQIYVYILGILLTVVAVIVSTRYTLSNIKRLWDTGKPKPTVIDENDKVQGESFKDDPAGIDLRTVHFVLDNVLDPMVMR